MAEQLDIPYSAAHADRRRIDVFGPDGEPRGVAILFIHGGGFAGGSKEQWHPVCRRFAEAGYVCASAGYRLAPRWKFPAWVEDVRLAMAWFRRQAGEFGFDPSRVATFGSSAGGCLALMLATIGPDDGLGDTDELAGADTRPAAVVAYCPATSFHEARRWPARTAYPNLMPVAERDDPALYRAASVEDRVAGREPPILLIHGTGDELIPYEDSLELFRQVRDAGGRAEIELLDGVEHGFGYGVTTGAQKKALGTVDAFLARALG